MDPDYGLDLEEVGRVIDTAEVVLVRFTFIEQRLLVDARSSSADGPLVRLVGRATSVEDRFRSLKELRPGFPLPDKITGFEWTHKVGTMADAGVWQRFEQRFRASGGEDAVNQLREVLGELRRAERREEIAAIRGGDGYQTLWERGAG